jgi:hypothetical protein
MYIQKVFLVQPIKQINWFLKGCANIGIGVKTSLMILRREHIKYSFPAVTVWMQ